MGSCMVETKAHSDKFDTVEGIKKRNSEDFADIDVRKSSSVLNRYSGCINVTSDPIMMMPEE